MGDTEMRSAARLGSRLGLTALGCAGCYNVSHQERQVITDEQVEQFHRIKLQLKDIKGLHEAMDVAGVQWDFKEGRALPGRVWDDTTPPELIPQVSRAFSPDEIQVARHSCNMGAPRNQDVPRVLIVLGVPAAGKSTIQPQVETLFGIKLADYVTVEGDLIRDAHTGWNDAISNDPSKGYRDMFDKYLKPITKPSKEALLQEALNNRQHIIWPVVAKDTASMVKFVQKCQTYGYTVDLVGLVVGHKESTARAKNRAHQIGRWNKSTLSAWENTYESLASLCEPDIGVDRVLVFDNHDFGNTKLLYARTHTIPQLRDAIKKRAVD